MEFVGTREEADDGTFFDGCDTDGAFMVIIDSVDFEFGQGVEEFTGYGLVSIVSSLDIV